MVLFLFYGRLQPLHAATDFTGGIVASMDRVLAACQNKSPLLSCLFFEGTNGHVLNIEGGMSLVSPLKSKPMNGGARRKLMDFPK